MTACESAGTYARVNIDAEVRTERKLSFLWQLRPRQLRGLAEALHLGQVTWDDFANGKVGARWRLAEGAREFLRTQVRSWPTPDASKQLGISGVEGSRPNRSPLQEGFESIISTGRWKDIHLTVASEREFPSRLATIPDPPLGLFSRGSYWRDEAQLRKRRVGIIGSRAATPSGLRFTRNLAADLAQEGCVIVSGLARGIDGAAHRGALDVDGTSVAVLGTGPDEVYPREHRAMFADLLARGGVLSEFPPGTPPVPRHFPRRNRLLAGWVDIVLVVEGGERSGARSTVDHALDQGREVAAIPRDPLAEGADLPNRLLYDGAHLVRSAEDVLLLLETLPPRSAVDVVPWQHGDQAVAVSTERRTKTGDEARMVPNIATDSNRASDRASDRAPDRALDRTLDGAPDGSLGAAPDAASGTASDPGSVSIHGLVLRALDRSTRTTEELAEHLADHDWSSLQTALVELELRGQILRLPGDRLRRKR